jgi:hypothetical protein
MLNQTQVPPFGPPFRPPGWDNPNNPHYPVPEMANFGLAMIVGVIFLILIKRKRKL